MYELRRGDFTSPHGHRVVMEYRDGTNDWNTLNASLNQDEYKIPQGLTDTALDVGGYLGSVGIGLAIDNPGLRVVIVEPVPPNVELIRRNIGLNNLDTRVQLLQGAAGHDTELVEVWYGYVGTEAAEHHAFVGNSDLAYDNGGELPHHTATYGAFSLKELVSLYGPISYLKVDTEGAEWAFLDSPSIGEVPLIVGEWHPVRGHTLGDMLALLNKTHIVTFTGPQTGPGGFSAVRR
jgi:FkbM family methyltransferase